MNEHEGVTIIPDPRAHDLRYDSQDWTTLLTITHAKSPEVAGVLHGFRCGGLRFHRGRTFALRPEYDPATSIWPDEAAYIVHRDEWLVPHAEIITWALNTMKRLEDQQKQRRAAGE